MVVLRYGRRFGRAFCLRRSNDSAEAAAAAARWFCWSLNFNVQRQNSQAAISVKTV
jgi:hypothetical protein